MNISIGILAGGKSTRMGENKALLQYNDQLFLERISKELSCFDEVLISAAKSGDYEAFGYPVVYDTYDGIGPMGGIYEILKKCQNEYVFLCGVDMPLIQKELVEYLCQFMSRDFDCYVMQDEERIHPLCGIYSKRMLPQVEKAIASGDYRLMHLLQQVQTKYISLEYTCFDRKLLRNINTKEDLKKLFFPIIFCVSGVKNSGKTSLIEQLIHEWKKSGYSVAVIKHDGHDYVMDHEGTDTYRFAQAGASSTVIYSDTQFSINTRRTVTAENLIQGCQDVDVIMLEGLKDSCYPKIEIVRGAISNRPVCKEDTLICIASDVMKQEESSKPVVDLNDIDGIMHEIGLFFHIDSLGSDKNNEELRGRMKPR